MEDGPQFSAGNDLAQRLHRRPEASILTDRERNPGLTAGVEHLLGVRAVQRQRLFAEHVLACGGTGDDLGAMQRMRRGQENRIDRRIGQRGLEVVDQMQPMPSAELARALHRRFDRGREPQTIITGRGIDESSSPAAEADDRSANQVLVLSVAGPCRMASTTAALSQSSPLRAIVSRSS